MNDGPCRPQGPFPIHEEYGRRTFSEKHYDTTSGSIRVERLWLCFSPQMNKPYCQSCWLFGKENGLMECLAIPRTTAIK